MMKAKLAVEIGFDKIRACVSTGREILNVPLGPISSPYSYPPIAVKTQTGYIFGEVAGLSAASSPDSTVFLYDYLRQNTVPGDAIIALLNTIKERVTGLYDVDVDSIALVTPSYFKDIIQSNILNKCVASVSNKIEVENTSISFIRSYLNVNIDQRVLLLDFRDNPAYASIISRGSRYYNEIGSFKIDGFSTIDCESFVEDVILSHYSSDLLTDGEIMTAWIQGEIASKISQDAISRLLTGHDVSYTIPFTNVSTRITQSEFQDWLSTKLDSVCEYIIGFVRDVGLTLPDISQIAILGGIFGSRFVRERIERYLSAYNRNLTLSYFYNPMDEWKICESVLKNHYNNDYALEL